MKKMAMLLCVVTIAAGAISCENKAKKAAEEAAKQEMLIKQQEEARLKQERIEQERIEQERIEQERIEQERIEQERQRKALQLNGKWLYERIDPTLYEIFKYTLEFRGDQYKYRIESESRAFGGDWRYYTREGDKIYVDGEVLMTIKPNGDIDFSGMTFEKVR